MDIKMPKHSLVIAGHWHWLLVKLPEIYVTGWTTLDLSWRFYVWDWTLVNGSLSVSSFMSALFDSLVEAWISIPD